LSSHSIKLFKELRRLEQRGLVVKGVHCKSNAGSFVVLSVSQVEVQQVCLVKLILELGAEGDHEAIGGSCFDWFSVCIAGSREVKGLYDSRILNELMHEPKIVEARRKYSRTDLFRDR